MTFSTLTAPDDDFNAPLLDRLLASKIFILFQKRCEIKQDPAGPAALDLLLKAADYSFQRHKMIIMHMGEFTLHDGDHLFRMLHLMERLIPLETQEQLSTPELLLLILSVFFHDIGMAPSEVDVNAWLGLCRESFTQNELEQHQRFQRFLSGRPEESKQIASYHKEGKHADADYVLRYLLSEYIRITHAERVTDVLEQDWNGKIVYRDMNLTPLLAQLCRSHNEEGIKLLELPHLHPVGQFSFICLPFIGSILRLADILDFDAKRTPKVLFAHLFVKHPISIREWNKHRAIKNWSISPTYIGFTAECSHPAIEASIKQFCGQLDYELQACATILNNLHDNLVQPFPSYYKIPLAPKVDTSKVSAELDLKGNPIYLFRNSAFKLNKEQIIGLLMGTKLYGQPEVALRELLQNSIDTCLLRSRLEEKWGNAYQPKIVISFSNDSYGKYLKVADNGMGMDQYIIDNYYSNIGVSYYRSSEFLELQSYVGASFTPTSRFGIGILSCFMISDQININTRRVHDNHSYGDPLTINIEGQESVFYTKKGTDLRPGTTTSLALRRENPWMDKTNQELLSYIKQTIPFPPFEMEILIDDEVFKHLPVVASSIDLSKLNPHYREPNENIRSFELIFDGSQGIFGKGNLMIIEQAGIPVTNLESNSVPIAIGEKELSFKTTISFGQNHIEKRFEQLDVLKLPSVVSKSNTSTYLRQSASRLALHGVEIPVSIFSRWEGDYYQRDKVKWPICLLVDINITGDLDINLNSARNEILIDEKWGAFENLLLTEIFSKVKAQVSEEYWNKFKNMYDAKTSKQNERFIEILKTV